MAILLIVAVAVIGPTFYAGYRNIGMASAAAAAGNYAEAERFYESAAHQLPWREDLLEYAGVSAFRAADLEGAIHLLEAARREKSLSLNGWDTLGSVYWTIGDRSQALSVWQSGAENYPGSTALLDRLAAAYHEQADFAAERIALTDRLAIGNDAGAHYRLGIVLMLSDVGRAEGELRTASLLDPQYESATTTLLAALHASASEPDDARGWTYIGRGLGLVEEWGAAAHSFEQAVTADAKNAEAWAWLGEARQHQGQDGTSELEQAMRLDPHDSVVRALRGLYWKRRGDDAAALAEYLAAARLEPESPSLQVSLGYAYAATGDLISALAAYQKATSLAPLEAAYWSSLAEFCADNGVQILNIGLPAAVKASELAPADPKVMDILGWTYTQAGYLYRGEQTLLKAISAAPEAARPHLHLAETYLRKGDYTSAAEQLKKAQQLDPDGSVGQFAAELLTQYFP